MGMAASQARLLTITARIHDVEYQAQSIQNAKVQLSTQSDQAYSEYLEALDATTLTIKALDNGEAVRVAATFSNLFSRDRVSSTTGLNYALVTDKNELVVEPEVYEDYKNYIGRANNDDPYEFAMFVLGENAMEGDLQDAELCAYQERTSENSDKKPSPKLTNLYEKLMNLVSGNEDYDHEKITIYDKESIDENDEEKLKEYEETMAAYRNLLYKECAEDVYRAATGNEPEDFRSNLFDYYVNIFRQIKAHNGCIPISDYDGMAGDAAHDSDWLQSMVKCGKLSIETYKIDEKTGELNLNGTSVASDSALEYTTTTTIDSRAAAKAEAEYEHKLKDIDKKDKQFDLSLSKLETERTALTTEYDSVKKVIEDNIDRTFGIFS